MDPFAIKCVIAIVILLTLFAICIWQYVVLNAPPYPLIDDRLFYRALCVIGALIGSIMAICVGNEYFREDPCIRSARIQKENEIFRNKLYEEKIKKLKEEQEILDAQKNRIIEDTEKLKERRQKVKDEWSRLEKEGVIEIKEEKMLIKNSETNNELANETTNKVINELTLQQEKIYEEHAVLQKEYTEVLEKLDKLEKIKAKYTKLLVN